MGRHRRQPPRALLPPHQSWPQTTRRRSLPISPRQSRHRTHFEIHMNWLTQLWRRITYLARRDQMDADLAEEMRLHLELKTAAAGDVSVARKQFGNVVRLKEKSRDAWGWGWLASVAQDLRYGWRNLMSARGFTVTAILSLALGLGPNT